MAPMGRLGLAEYEYEYEYDYEYEYGYGDEDASATAYTAVVAGGRAQPPTNGSNTRQRLVLVLATETVREGCRDATAADARVRALALALGRFGARTCLRTRPSASPTTHSLHASLFARPPSLHASPASAHGVDANDSHHAKRLLAAAGREPQPRGESRPVAG